MNSFSATRLSVIGFALPGLLLSVLITGCTSAQKRPVFYPNHHIQTVGKAQAQRDTDDCMALANSYGVSTNKDGEIGKKAATGAALGGIGAGAYGLVRGDAGERALAGAAAGAATGAVKGGIDSTELSPTFKRFVQRCLRERGYDVIGWE